jgi:phage I-like protein
LGGPRPCVNYLNLRADGTLDPEQKARILASVREAAANVDLVIAYHHQYFWGERYGPDTPPGREARLDRFETQAGLVSRYLQVVISRLLN